MSVTRPTKNSWSSPCSTSSGATGAIVSPFRSIWTRNTPRRWRRPPASTEAPSNGPPGCTRIATLNSRTWSSIARCGDPRSGMSRPASTTMAAVPTRAIGRPTGVSSNSDSGSMPLSRSSPDTVRFVEVPMAVVTPPRTEA